jgi:hypothetical protein
MDCLQQMLLRSTWSKALLSEGSKVTVTVWRDQIRQVLFQAV